MRTIVQICPDIRPGSGVAAVAHHLEQEWLRSGYDVRRFTMREAWGGWLPASGGGIRGRLVLILRVVWFSTIGTVLARRYLRENPQAVSVCHNDVLAGDIYVNHGILQAAMRARGNYLWRMARNPLHIFTAARDRYRYAGHAGHQLVVNLVAEEESLLRQEFPNLRVPTVTLGNGVDTNRYQVPGPAERADARSRLRVADGEFLVAFIGHEFDRKGLPILLEAVAALPPSVRLVVVGGTPDMIAATRALRASRRLGDRVLFVGAQEDPRPYLHAADVFALPSAYESYGLVVLEALACGLPVVATATGCVPAVVTNGVNGYITSPTAESFATAIERTISLSGPEARAAARTVAEQNAWGQVAADYLRVMETRLAPRPERG